MDALGKRGLAESLDKRKYEWHIFWFTLDELGERIHNFAIDNGMTNTVCTLFELSEGENTVNEEFHGVDNAVLVKALKALEKRGKCELILCDDVEGVKFF